MATSGRGQHPRGGGRDVQQRAGIRNGVEAERPGERNVQQTWNRYVGMKVRQGCDGSPDRRGLGKIDTRGQRGPPRRELLSVLPLFSLIAVSSHKFMRVPFQTPFFSSRIRVPAVCCFLAKPKDAARHVKTRACTFDGPRSWIICARPPRSPPPGTRRGRPRRIHCAYRVTAAAAAAAAAAAGGGPTAIPPPSPWASSSQSPPPPKPPSHPPTPSVTGKL